MLLCSGYLVEIWQVEFTEIPSYQENRRKNLRSVIGGLKIKTKRINVLLHEPSYRRRARDECVAT